MSFHNGRHDGVGRFGFETVRLQVSAEFECVEAQLAG